MWHTHSNADLLKVVAGLGRAGRACEKPVKTIALSWHTDERPDRAAMCEAADEYLTAMGWQEHQAVIVCHTDTRHAHVHIILNRVHPVTGRVLDDSNDRPRAQAWALGYELAHGRVFCSGREMAAADRRREQELARDARNRELVAPCLDIARQLAARSGHVVDGAGRRGSLSAEQLAAARHMLAGGDLVAVTGYAGTGKTRLLDRTRRSWEAAGYRVRGATLSGIAARNLEQGSGISSRTIASLEKGWEHKRDPLTARDVLVVDEAGMVSAPQMQRVLAEAVRVGAKVALIGDPEQLQPINSPAPYRAIAQEIGGVTLTEVRRQVVDWQRHATRELATRETRRALDRYHADGMVNQAPTVAAARRALIDGWDRSRCDHPRDDQIILAYRRADVAALNVLAREKMREAGALGTDQMISTVHGDKMFGVGDHIVFTRNDTSLGVNNGTRGRIEDLTEHRLTARVIEADKQRLVSVPLAEYAAFQHGYALTIHRAQGITVDRTHVLASRQFDRHIAYVAMTRHRSELALHYARTDFADLDRVAATFGRAPVTPNTARTQVQSADIFCTERLRRDYAERPQSRTRGAGAGHDPDNHRTVTASEMAFLAAERRLEADAAEHAVITPRSERDALAERHKAERDYFFIERRAFVKALRQEVYVRAKDSLQHHWVEHTAFARTARAQAADEAGSFELRARSAVREGNVALATHRLEERDAARDQFEPEIALNARAVAAHQKTMIRQAQDDAAAAFINERYSNYAALKERQMAERHDLKALQGARDRGELFDQTKMAELTAPFVISNNDLDVNATRISHILDRLSIIRDSVPGASSMASDIDREYERQQQALFNKKAEADIERAVSRFTDLCTDAQTALERPGQTQADTEHKARLGSFARELDGTARQARDAADGQAKQPGLDDDARARILEDARIAAARQADVERMAREQEAEQRRQLAAAKEARDAALVFSPHRDARERAGEALGKHYDILRPYQSLAAAGMDELRQFRQEREDARKAISAEQDPEMRRVLILADKANVADFEAHLANRNARMSEVITGRFVGIDRLRERQSAHEKFYDGMRGEITGEIGNVRAEADDRLAMRRATHAADLRAEARDSLEALERRRRGVTEAGRARSQETQSTTRSASDMGSFVAQTMGDMEQARARDRQSFTRASNEASRAQNTQADRTETEERQRREELGLGRGRGR